MINARSIQGIVILIVGTFIAIWLGVSLATNQLETLGKFGAAALLLLGVFLGSRIWLLFIFFTSMNVVLIRWVGTVEMGQFMFLGFSLALFMMRKLNFRLRLGELELWALLIMICIAQAYLRNPVGLSVFGSGNVGGRPYIAIGLWIASSAILSTLIVPAVELKWALRLSIIGAFVGIPLQMARYGSVSSGTGAEEGIDLSGSGRIGSFMAIGNALARWVSCRISPLRACMHPFWGAILLASLVLAAASGFRNAIANVGFIYLVAICYHGGLRSFMASMLLAAFGLGLLALININFPLPGNLQRALAPLPGTWEERYRQSGTRSTEWRTEMWKEALTSDQWIHNKFLGDGIGINAEQLARMKNLESSNARGMSGMDVVKEQMLIVGAYHSGPLHSIRMTGYVGLLVLLLAMIRLAVHAHRQIMRCKGTEWAPIALFFGIPLISQPFFFTLVFGEYHTAVAQVFFGMAMVRLMERNIPLPAYVVNRRGHHVPLVVRHRLGDQPTARSA